jgi:aspartyl-tRNA(Asn)/glutamyl-tRNA(Gln) amidotransferase subunit C
MQLSPQLSIEDVEKIARLARLELSEEEKTLFVTQLSSILGFVDKLNEVDTADVEPMAHSLPIRNVFGADELAPETVGERDAVLAAFPERQGDMLKVKAVFGK